MLADAPQLAAPHPYLQPEMCCNVQQYAKGAYLRKAEAEQCQVQSTLLLPLFISPRRTGCVGVLEVVQTSEDMAFVDVAALLSDALEVRGAAYGHDEGRRVWKCGGGVCVWLLLGRWGEGSRARCQGAAGYVTAAGHVTWGLPGDLAGTDRNES